MRNVRQTLLIPVALVATLGLLTSCNETSNDASAAVRGSSHEPSPVSTSPRLATGSTLQVSLSDAISSETAKVGDSWNGTIAEAVSGARGVVIPAGSAVNGVVTACIPAKRGSLAMLDLAVRGIDVNGRHDTVIANAPQVVAGSTRARNLGVVAGGAAAGAVVGNNVGDHNHTVLGAVVGAATAAGIVSQTKGYQVELKAGTVMNFTISESVSIR